MSTAREELRQNIEAFKAVEDSLLEEHRGKYALLYEGKLVRVFSEKENARIEAARRYPNGGFAISPAIGSPPVSLGTVGLYAMPVGV